MEPAGEKLAPVPRPEDLVKLAKAPVDCVWPESEEQRAELFQQLDFESGTEFERRPEDSHVRSFELTTALPGKIFGTWSSYDDKFMGINLQMYSVMEPESPLAWRGHDELQALLSSLYGGPARPWDDEVVPPSIWKANGRDIVIHFFHERDSGVMLSIDNTDLAAAAEADATDR